MGTNNSADLCVWSDDNSGWYIFIYALANTDPSEYEYTNTDDYNEWNRNRWDDDTMESDILGETSGVTVGVWNDFDD